MVQDEAMVYKMRCYGSGWCNAVQNKGGMEGGEAVWHNTMRHANVLWWEMRPYVRRERDEARRCEEEVTVRRGGTVSFVHARGCSGTGLFSNR